MEDQILQTHGFDAEIDVEWAEYQVALGDHLAKLPDGTRYQVESLWQQKEPLVVVTREGEEAPFELTAPAINSCEFNATQGAELSRLQVTVNPTTLDWGLVFDSDAHLADHIAWVAVQLLRTVYDVPSPAVLNAGPLTVVPPKEPEVEAPAFDPNAPRHAESAEELADAVEQMFAELSAEIVHRTDNFFRVGDAEGSITVRVDGNRMAVWVVVTPVRVRATTAAIREVALINRDAHFGRYYLSEGWLIAEVRLPASPFVPRHLMDTVVGLLHETRSISGDFAWRTHGKVLDR